MIIWNKIRKDMYDPKIKTVKYLWLFGQKDQKKSDEISTLPQKCTIS